MTSNAQSLRTPSMSSSEYDEKYSARVQHESDNMVEDDQIILSDSPQLEYATLNSQGNQVSKVTDYTTNTRQQCMEHDAPALNNNTFNIQLQYDINQALDPESQDGNFWAILLHGSMEHLASNIKNIKESFGKMQKYILSKAIESDKDNNIKDFKDVSKAAWEFISSLYKAHWDNLFVDDLNTSLRNKVKLKFSPQAIKELNINKGKSMVKLSYISTLLPPIPAKLPKKVTKISKYFKKNSSSIQKKSYTQVSSNSSNTARETLKIKEAIPSLQNKKIKLIQKIISSEGKPKPHINMTTKRPLYKQVIVPMSIDNTITNKILTGCDTGAEQCFRSSV